MHPVRVEFLSTTEESQRRQRRHSYCDRSKAIMCLFLGLVSPPPPSPPPPPPPPFHFFCLFLFIINLVLSVAVAVVVVVVVVVVVIIIIISFAPAPRTIRMPRRGRIKFDPGSSAGGE